jgi:hypothetical protein
MSAPRGAKHSWLYKEYMHSLQWQRVRTLALERANYQCQRCGWQPKLGRRRWYGIGLQVHHRTYEHLADERLSELEVLCVTCHSKQHGRYRERVTQLPPAEIPRGKRRRAKRRGQGGNEAKAQTRRPRTHRDDPSTRGAPVKTSGGGARVSQRGNRSGPNPGVG